MLYECRGTDIYGFMVEADVNGFPISPGSREAYCYVIFTDRNFFDQRQGFAIARVKKTDFLESISMHKAPLFKKYYAPAGGFTEPGIGGSSTLIVTLGTDNLAWAEVHFCPPLQEYVLIYQTNQKIIQLRTARNLRQWSDPVTLYLDRCQQ